MGLSGGCRARLTQKRCRQLAVFARFSRSVETWQRFDWWRMVFTRCASSERQFSAPFGRYKGINDGTREAGGAVAESLVEGSSTRKRTVARSIG